MYHSSWLFGILFSVSMAGELQAQQPVGKAAEDLPFEAQIQACWTTMDGADTPATIAFRLKPDGNLDGMPVIKSQGQGALNEAFAQSARRAVMKCAPYKVPDKLEIESTFIPDPTKAESRRVQPQTPVRQEPVLREAELQDDDPRTRIVDLGTVSIGFKVPDGLCAIDPKRGGYHEKLWTALAPPPERKSELKALDVDCESLKKLEAGSGGRPKYAFTVMRFLGGKQPVPSSLSAFLDDMQKQSSKEPLTPRFWETPAVAGSPFLGRDEHAVYFAQRVLEDGKIVVSGVSAFTLVERMPILMNHFAVEGPDLAAEREKRIAGIVQGVRVGRAD